MPKPSLYNPQYHDSWAWSLAIKGATDAEVADAFGISRKQVCVWKEKYPTFAAALQSGKDAADAQVEKKLFERCMGFEYEEEEQVIDVAREGGPKIGRIVKRKRRVLPDTMAMMYWLNNRKRSTGEWSQRQEVALSAADDSFEDVVIRLPPNGQCMAKGNDSENGAGDE